MGAAIATFFAGIQPKTWKIIGIVLAVAAFCWGVWAVVDSLTDKAYAQGRGDEKQAWETAEDKFLATAASAKTEADRAQALRDAKHAEAVAEEREKIDEAVAEGRSPFDVMFPATGGVRD
jgi:hypothetical protein